MDGLVNSDVSSLVALENVLYALTPDETLKSVDSGESWESVSLTLAAGTTKVAIADSVLYASNSELDGVTLLRLSDAGDVFQPVEGMPDFEEDTLHKEWRKKRLEARQNGDDVDKVQAQWKADQHRAFEEWMTNGTFTGTKDTIFMEY